MLKNIWIEKWINLFLNQLISKSVTKSQLIKIGIIVQGNSLEENERFSKILIDSFDITGITKRISKNIPDELTRKFLRRLPRASLNPKPLKMFMNLTLILV